MKNSFLWFYVNINIHQYQQSTSLYPLFFLTITAESTLPFLPSHISSPVTSPSPTSSSSSHCASSLSPRKLQLYPSCRQPLLVSRWTIHNFDPHSRTANAPYDDLLRSWHHQSPWIKIYWHHSKSYSFLAERPTEVKVSIFIRSMGPISEADMVSTYWYSETPTFHFHFYFPPSLFTFLDDSHFLLSPVLFHGLLLSPVLAGHQTFLPGVQT